MHNSVPDNWTEQQVTPRSRIYWSDEGDIVVQVGHIVIHFHENSFKDSFFQPHEIGAYERAKEMIWYLHRDRQEDT